MIRTLPLFATALALATAAVLAPAQAGPSGDKHDKRAEAYFSRLDGDNDGKVTAAEIDAMRAERFSALDADGNGAVSLEEYQNARIEQIRQRLAKRFERHDEDGDGVLSLEEMDRKRGAKGWIERLDANGDGAIDRSEFAAMRERHRR